MKRILAILLVCTMAVLAGCEGKENQSEIADYDRLGSQVGQPNFINPMPTDFKQLYNESQWCVKLEIIKYMGDFDNNENKTVFLAKILNSYKGNLKTGDEIYILQAGSSGNYWQLGFPLFAISDVFVVNLEFNEIKYGDTGKKIYELVEQRFALTQIYTYNGTDYAIARTADEFYDSFDIEPVSDDLKERIMQSFKESDPINGKIGPIGKIYVFNELEKEIENLN